MNTGVCLSASSPWLGETLGHIVTLYAPDGTLSLAADLYDHDCARVLRINVTKNLGGKSYLNFVSHL